MITLKQRINVLESRTAPPRVKILMVKENQDAEAMQMKDRKATGWTGDYVIVRLVSSKYVEPASEAVESSRH